MNTTLNKLEQLEKLADAATQGPWEIDGKSLLQLGDTCDTLIGNIYGDADRAFIAA